MKNKNQNVCVCVCHSWCKDIFKRRRVDSAEKSRDYQTAMFSLFYAQRMILIIPTFSPDCFLTCFPFFLFYLQYLILIYGFLLSGWFSYFLFSLSKENLISTGALSRDGVCVCARVQTHAHTHRHTFLPPTHTCTPCVHAKVPFRTCVRVCRGGACSVTDVSRACLSLKRRSKNEMLRIELFPNM